MFGKREANVSKSVPPSTKDDEGKKDAGQSIQPEQPEKSSPLHAKSPEVKALVEQLELQYDKRLNKDEDNDYELSPEIEDFLDELGNQFSQN